MTEFRSTFGQETAAKADEKKAAKKDEGAHTHTDDPKAPPAKAEGKFPKTEAKAEAKAEKKEEKAEAKEAKEEKEEKHEGHPRLAKQLLDLIERIEDRETPFTDDEQQIMQTAVKRLSRTMGDYRAPE